MTRDFWETMSMRYFCVHGHFYQPPRENPLTGTIPIESGAKPFPNWNERVHAECYRPNAAMGNFEHLSFNIGPTLCAWLASEHPDTLNMIIAQDRVNVKRFGVGNAIAQPYNHSILPLATYRDKVTQIVWGLADFEHRYGRRAQGMWLPEAAVDLETLNVLADHGIEYIILAPWQANRKEVDVTHPYQVQVNENKKISVFFYHRDLSSGISFNPAITINADQFALHELLPRYAYPRQDDGQPQLILLASDGELYGHHQPLRDYFLSHLLNGASKNVGIEHMYPALWLQKYPPEEKITIRENTSWSCHHGLTRWQGKCGCVPGDGSWKTTLRSALDRLAGRLDRLFEKELAPVIPDPWRLRNAYIHVILGNRPAEDLINEHAGSCLPAETSGKISLLLKAQLERQRMFTSCGWFFEDFDRIEPKNNVAYAAQAIRLAFMATGIDLSDGSRRDLKSVISPVTGLRGDQVLVNYLRLASV
jgi:hypothetical protein